MSNSTVHNIKKKFLCLRHLNDTLKHYIKKPNAHFPKNEYFVFYKKVKRTVRRYNTLMPTKICWADLENLPF